MHNLMLDDCSSQCTVVYSIGCITSAVSYDGSFLKSGVLVGEDNKSLALFQFLGVYDPYSKQRQIQFLPVVSIKCIL